MEKSKVIAYLKEKRDFLYGDENCSQEVIDALLNVSDEALPILESIPFRKPAIVQLIAFFPGGLGVDRLYLGDKKKAILKYFTLAGFGIWWVKDILSAKKRCREYNCKKLLETISNPDVAKEMIEKDEKLKKAFVIAKAVTPIVLKGAKDVHDSFEGTMDVY